MIYLNNAATTYPKFPEMIETISHVLSHGLIYCNRDSIESTAVPKIIFQLREEIGSIFSAKENYHIVFATNDTLCLNNIIFGQEYTDKNVILTTNMEHNSISRPLYQLAKRNKNIKVIYLNTTADGNIENLEKVISQYKNNIKYLILSQINNVTGNLLDINKIGALLYKNDIPFIVDTAQSLVYADIDVEKAHISVATFSGHKGLNGPQGTGGMYIRDGFDIKPILFGGTGNSSSSINPDIVFPDSFEVGTPAVHDILGLARSVDVIHNVIGINKYRARILANTNYLLSNLKTIPNVIIYGNQDKKQSPIISFNIKGHDCKSIGSILAEKNIVCRTGYHCSALSIQVLNVEKEFHGTVRLSCGYETTTKELDYVVDILKKI